MSTEPPEPAEPAEPAPPAELAEPAGAQPTGAPSPSSGIQRSFARFVGNPWAWLLALLFLFALPLGRTFSREVPQPPALAIALPTFELTNQRGEPFGLEKLRGKIWVADFVFLSCPTVCPKLTKRMAEIQHRTRNLGDA